MPESDGMKILIENKWNIIALFIFLIILTVFTFIILPLMDGIILGLVFAYIARPLKREIEKKGVSNYLSSIIATFTIITPLIMILGLGLVEIVNQLILLAQNQWYFNSLIIYINELDVPKPIYDQIQNILFNLSSIFLPQLAKIPQFGISVALFLLNVIISIFVCFFLLLDGFRFIDALMDIIPKDKLPIAQSFKKHLDHILAGIFLGNIYAAMITGILSIAVFYYFNVPHIPAMSALMLLAGLIPIFAGWMVLGPMAVFRYFEFGFENAAVFLIVSSIILYAPNELFLKPYIIGRTSSIHPLLVMIAFIGGGLVGGIGGFFMAPIFLGLLIAAYRAYMEFKGTNGEIFKHEDI
ncbi:MAG: AI-2E family transporter [Methanosarcinales archaeon]|nr:AI-2E family transporter [Methanosarcinales archaeon]